jgi:hypothetical protein
LHDVTLGGVRRKLLPRLSPNLDIEKHLVAGNAQVTNLGSIARRAQLWIPRESPRYGNLVEVIHLSFLLI